jgi:hypothetical protein
LSSSSPEPVDHGLLSKIAHAQIEESKNDIDFKPTQIEQVKATSTQNSNNLEDMTKEDLEREYLTKAWRYLVSLPTSDSTISAGLIKAVIIKLRHSFRTFTDPLTDSPPALQSKYIEAILNYVNGLSKNSTKPIDAGLVEQTLKDNDGNFLQLCAKLIEMQLIALENLDEVVGVCQAVLAVVPAPVVHQVTIPSLKSGKPQSRSAKEDASEEDVKTKLPGSIGINTLGASSIGQKLAIKPESLLKPVSMDLMDKINVWPTQEKRANRKSKLRFNHRPQANLRSAAGCRTVLLGGVSWAKNIHELQGCVWGGKLESIALPQSGSSFAMVKFLTAEGCQKFFDATANGIEVPGSKTLVTVEKHQGPNSVNDVLKNCSEGDASRCVRVVDADSDWGDTALRRIAIGTSKIKREIDIIKRGRTAQGVSDQHGLNCIVLC